MKTLRFSINIQASREKVWDTLWNDETFRSWTNIIDEGTYMVGEMREGNEVQFISSISGYGVTSLVEKLSPREFVSFRHMADTKDGGKQRREKEWADGIETYLLAENDGVTTLTVSTDVPPGQEKAFDTTFPKALERIKILSERNTRAHPENNYSFLASQ